MNKSREIDFRKDLLQSFKKRQLENPSYNLKKFAEDLGISPQRLNMVIKGRTGLSPEMAQQITVHLQMSGEDADFFVTAVTAKHHRSAVARRSAKEKLQKKFGQNDFEKVDVQDLQGMTDWFHFAAWSLVDVRDFKPEYPWIAKRLGISEQLARQTYRRLFEGGFLVEKDGRWERDSDKMDISVPIKSEQLRSLHHQVLKKAQNSIDMAIENRHLTSTFLPLNEEQIKEAREKIKNFSMAFVEDFSDKILKPTRVFALGVQLFAVDSVSEGSPDV